METLIDIILAVWFISWLSTVIFGGMSEAPFFYDHEMASNGLAISLIVLIVSTISLIIALLMHK